MTYDKKLVEDWLCEHFPYHLRVNKDMVNWKIKFQSIHPKTGT